MPQQSSALVCTFSVVLILLEETMVFTPRFNPEIQEHQDTNRKDIPDQTSPTCITERMTTNSSMNLIARIGFKTNPTSQLSKNKNMKLEIHIHFIGAPKHQ